MENQEEGNSALDQRRKEFSDTLFRLVLRQREAHPERFPNFKHPLMKQSTPEQEARLVSKEYIQRIVHRGVVFLDELLYETCLHVGIEPSLEALYNHVASMSEEEVVDRAIVQLRAEEDLKIVDENGRMDPELMKLKKSIVDTLKKVSEMRKIAP